MFSKMNRKLRPTRSLYQLKDEQVNFLLEDIEKKIEEYKKIVEKKEKDKQLAEAKKGGKKQLQNPYKRK